MRRYLTIVLASVSLIACSDNNTGGPNNIQFQRDTGSPNNVTPDTGNPSDMPSTPDAGDMGTADASEEFDFDVQAAGFMHGNWTVTRAEGGAPIANLRLRHEAGETNLDGTFEMTEPPAFGLLGGTTWMGDQFTTSWTVLIDGFDERFGLAMCTRDGGDDQLACRHTDPISGNVFDAIMVRN